jgi:hypothetical protein
MEENSERSPASRRLGEVRVSVCRDACPQVAQPETVGRGRPTDDTARGYRIVIACAVDLLHRARRTRHAVRDVGISEVRRRAKIDSNQAQVVDAFKSHGCLVESLAPMGNGIPDLLVTNPRHGVIWLVEVKRPKAKLTEDQVKFQSLGWPVHVVRSEADVQELVMKGRVTW